MSQGANVRSVEALVQFKNGLVAFSEDARVILDGVQMEIRRTRNWLERDQLTYWRSQVKRWQQEVAMARTELHRRKLTQMNSDVVTDTEQKEALKLAQRRLAHAEEMVEKVKRWIPVLEHAIADYRAQAQPLGDHLSGGFENTLSLLDRMVKSLDAYLKLSAPAAPVLPPEMSSGNETATSSGFTSASNGPAEVEKPKESSGEEPAVEAPTAAGGGSPDHREPV
jgi:hypothetical protein